ncbi:MAG: CAP domain-containing protein [Methanoregula sp.]
MPICDFCGKPTTMPFHCQYCGGNFCDEHRLPPNHNCAGIEIWKKKPVPGVGIRYGHGGGAVPTMGGYAPERTGRKPKKPWGAGIPYLKIAIAIIVIIILLLLYLGLTGYFPGAEKTPVKSSGTPETVSTIPAPANDLVLEPALPESSAGNSSGLGTGQPAILMAPVATPVPTTLPAPAPTHVPTPAPAKIMSATKTPTPPFTLPPGPAPGNPYTVSTTGLASRVHDLINEERTAQGLTALNTDSALASLARSHSADMAGNNYFSHENLNGQTPTDRGNAAGYTCRKDYGSYYTYGIAENIFQNNLYDSVTSTNGVLTYAWTSPDEIAQSTVDGWMNSPGHRKNILTSTYDREGIGVAISTDDKVYITEDFC